MTARPFDRPGLHASIGVKGVYDTSNGNCRAKTRRPLADPEISGIYSNTSADGMFGVAPPAATERNLGYNQPASRTAGAARSAADENNWGTIPQRASLAGDITNRPTGSVYSVPQKFELHQRRAAPAYQRPADPAVQASQGTGHHAGLHLLGKQDPDQAQRPVGLVQLRAVGELVDRRSGVLAALLQGVRHGNSDIAMGAADFATKTQNKSLGFNAVWKPTRT
jgi:hypothetical protein